jgi:hypothetical protein
MSSMAIGRYKSADVANQRGGYWEPYVITAPILHHKDGHYVKPNKATFKYPDFKEDANPDAHVKVFNVVIKKNVETSEEYIINLFNYTELDWCHNYMSKFPNCIFLELTQAFYKHHQKIQNDEQIYMKQKETKRVEVLLWAIQKLVHGLQIPTTIFF